MSGRSKHQMEDGPLLIDFVAPTSLLREPNRTSALPVIGNGPPGTFVLFPNGLRVSLPTDQIVFADDTSGHARVGFGGMRFVGSKEGRLGHCQVADQSAFLSLGAERPRSVSRHTSAHPRDGTSGLSRDGGELSGGIVKLSCGWQSRRMTSQPPSYRGYRFPPEIISHAVWLYHRFGLSFRDVEDLLAERGVSVTYESIRQWCLTFGLDYARRLRRRRGRMGDTWHLDEVFVKIQGRQQYLWRAVDEDGDVIDILVQSRRHRRAAIRFFRKLLKGQGCVPRRLITDKLRSYPAACRTVMPSVVHCTDRYANNRAEVSHQPTRERERQMRRFKSAAHAQRFLSVHGPIQNLFRVGRHLLRAVHHRLLRTRAFGVWREVTCV
mgnify:CR=1 FL=1